MTWRPIHPVAVVLQPVVADFDGVVPSGVIIGRRGIEPHIGVMALPGGFVEFGEKAEVAAAREIFEEMSIPVGGLRFSHSFADQEGHFLMFFHARPIWIEHAQMSFKPSAECPKMDIATDPMQLAFESHTEALKLFFEDLRRPTVNLRNRNPKRR